MTTTTTTTAAAVPESAPEMKTIMKASESGTFWEAEKLVVSNRTLTTLGRAIVDNEEALSVELAEAVMEKAVGMRNDYMETPKISATNDTITPTREVYNSQAGLIKGELWKRTEEGTLYRIELWTAKHNVMNDITEDGVARRYHSSWLVRHDIGVNSFVEFQEAGRRADRAAKIRIGGDPVMHDITVGKQLYRNYELGKEMRVFERVSDDFRIKPGMRIGMAVYNITDVTEDSIITHKDLSEEELKGLYGSAGEVVIHTGSVLHVNPIHIQHDINCCGGCAGAVLFLLDKDQPSSVTEEDYGKAIGIHAGKHPDHRITRNVGYKFPPEVSLYEKVMSLVQ